MSQDTFGFIIADLARMLKQQFYGNIDSGELTHAQSRALVVIAKHQGVRQVDLAEMLDVKPITFARLVDQLAAFNLVERRTDPDDRRAYRIYLTDTAMPFLSQIRAAADRVKSKALAGLSPEEEQHLVTLLNRVRQNLSNSN